MNHGAKKLLFSLILVFFSMSLYGQETDVLGQLNSSDTMQKKMGLRYAQKDIKFEDKVIELFKSDSENIEVKMMAARTLGAYKSDKSLNALLEVLKQVKAEDLQSSILSALSKYEKKEVALKAIVNMLQEGKTEYIRSVSVQLLKYNKSDLVFNAFIEALEDDSALVRKKVTVALGEQRNKKAIPALTKVSKNDENEEVKANAKSALYKLGVKNENLKSVSTALILGVTPINGLGLWYSGDKALAITNFTLELAAVGLMLYGFDGFNELNSET